MTKSNLSICIPTYKRRDFLRQLLWSISEQPKCEHIEIIVSDNHSNDGTCEMLKEFKVKLPNIVYHEWSENVGPDRNYMKCVELATNKYCWLMGSDDVIEAGAISKVFEAIENEEDIYLFARTESTFELKPIRKRLWLDDRVANTVFDLSQEKELKRYFEISRGLGAVFSYLSSIIVKKSAWDSIRFDSSYLGTAYSHVYVLLSLMIKGSKLRYSTTSIVRSRAGNDTFLTDWVRRALIDFRGYSKLANDLLLDESTKIAFKDIIKHEVSLWTLMKIRGAGSKKEHWKSLKAVMVNEFAYPKFYPVVADISYPFLHLAYLIKKRIKLN